MNENEIKSALTQIGNDIRQAERQMFNGKAAEAMEIVTATGGLIEKVKAADPQNALIKGHETKYLKLKSDLEKRLNKPAPSAPAAAPAPAAGGASKPVDLPWDAKKPLMDTMSNLKVVERNLQQIETVPADQKESLIKRIDEYLKAAKDNLETAKSESARKGVPSHPDLDDAAGKIANAEARYSGAKSGAVAAMNAAAEQSAEVDKDIARMKAEYERLREVFNQAAVPYYNDLEPMKKMLNTIEMFEKNDKTNLQKLLGEFTSKYGATKNEIDNSASAKGYPGNDRASYPFEMLNEGMQKMSGARKLAAEDLVKKLNDMMQRLPQLHDFSREAMYGTLKEWMDLAAKFDSGNPAVISAKETMERTIAEDQKKLEAKIDAKEWPGNTKGSEADAALTFFKNDRDWGARPKGNGPEDQPRIPLGVSIHGSWSVQATDVLGKPTQYGMPAFIAVQIEREQPTKRVRVYDVTLRTQEGPNPEQKPPFTSITVGNSWYVRPDKIK